MSFKREYRRRIGVYYIMYLRGILTFIPEESFGCLVPIDWLS